MNIDILVLFKKYKSVILWSFGSIALSIVLALLVILPQLVVIRQTDAVIQQNQQKIENIKTKIKDLQSINTEEYTKDLGVTLVALPVEKDLPAAFDQIQILLAKNRLQLSNISFDSSPVTANSSGATQSFQVRLGITGDQDSFKNFVLGLKSAPQIMKLSGLTISASQGGLSQNNVILTAYYEAPPATLGAVDQNVSLLNAQDKELIDTLSSNAQSIPVISSSTASGPRGKSNPFQ